MGRSCKFDICTICWHWSSKDRLYKDRKGNDVGRIALMGSPGKLRTPLVSIATHISFSFYLIIAAHEMGITMWWMELRNSILQKQLFWWFSNRWNAFLSWGSNVQRCDKWHRFWQSETNHLSYYSLVTIN